MSSEHTIIIPSENHKLLSFDCNEVGGYKLGRTLGQGSCAVVRLGTHMVTGQQVAVKIIKPKQLKEQKEVLREVEALQMLHTQQEHPHIIKLVKVLRENGFTCLILELGERGELFEHISKTGKMTEEEARRLFRQILSGVQYCHANMVIHRDLKPENLILDSDGNIKISDFGLSNILKPGRLFSTFCGSPMYSPPEVVMQKKYHGHLADVWSLGVILFIMVTGGMPWCLEANQVKNIDALIQAKYCVPDFLGLSAGVKELIGMMLTATWEERATVEKLMNHPWVNIGYDSPPPSYFKPMDVISEENIDADVMQQMCLLGVDVSKARTAIQNDPTSASLYTYNLLLAKVLRARELSNTQFDPQTVSETPKYPKDTDVLRIRSRSTPEPKSPEVQVLASTTSLRQKRAATMAVRHKVGVRNHTILDNTHKYIYREPSSLSLSEGAAPPPSYLTNTTLASSDPEIHQHVPKEKESSKNMFKSLLSYIEKIKNGRANPPVGSKAASMSSIPRPVSTSIVSPPTKRDYTAMSINSPSPTNRRRQVN
eukprot:TRINITY_DN2840_c0_g1_i1.p1 TRINITY_DN2840_c0_g1~~TRINITY_DN2840_c0_g1_i1.p1  ORF type:complete len:541 (+),score=146.23 TRINITY_DN2840_c0_g1_i1:368-1990(+)